MLKAKSNNNLLKNTLSVLEELEELVKQSRAYRKVAKKIRDITMEEKFTQQLAQGLKNVELADNIVSAEIEQRDKQE